MTNQPEASLAPKPPQSRWEKVSLAVQLALSFVVAGGVFLFLVFGGGRVGEEEEKRPARPEEVVQIIGLHTISIKPGTPLDDRLDKNAKVRLATLTTPFLPVTGAVLASLRPGDEEAKDTWQFASPELLSAFADWQRSVTDVKFQKKQLELITEMNKKRVERQGLVVARKKNLLAIGTETKEVLAAEETTLIAYQIQERKEVHEQTTTVLLSERTQATLARQLQQNGLEPTMLRSAAIEGDIVVAEVPERMIRHVKVGMNCVVEFFALPDHKPPFRGKVSSISPVISKEKRVANVQFVVKNPAHEIRPGMFARIGLGNDRQALLMPADGVLHVGDYDYVLVADPMKNWQIYQVETGELVKSEMELLSGFSLNNPARPLQKGDRVIGKEAILLKPILIRALQAVGR